MQSRSAIDADADADADPHPRPFRRTPTLAQRHSTLSDPDHGGQAPSQTARRSPRPAAPESSLPFYSEHELRIVYECCVEAQRIWPTILRDKRTPRIALFKAYNDVLPKHGIQPTQDLHICKLLFTIGGEPFSRFNNMFRAVMARENVILELSDESGEDSSLSFTHEDYPSSQEAVLQDSAPGGLVSQECEGVNDDSSSNAWPQQYSDISRQREQDHSDSEFADDTHAGETWSNQHSFDSIYSETRGHEDVLEGLSIEERGGSEDDISSASSKAPSQGRPADEPFDYYDVPNGRENLISITEAEYHGPNAHRSLNNHRLVPGPAGSYEDHSAQQALTVAPDDAPMPATPYIIPEHILQNTAEAYQAVIAKDARISAFRTWREISRAELQGVHQAEVEVPVPSDRMLGKYRNPEETKDHMVSMHGGRANFYQEPPYQIVHAVEEDYSDNETQTSARSQEADLQRLIGETRSSQRSDDSLVSSSSMSEIATKTHEYRMQTSAFCFWYNKAKEGRKKAQLEQELEEPPRFAAHHRRDAAWSVSNRTSARSRTEGPDIWEENPILAQMTSGFQKHRAVQLLCGRKEDNTKQVLDTIAAHAQRSHPAEPSGSTQPTSSSPVSENGDHLDVWDREDPARCAHLAKFAALAEQHFAAERLFGRTEQSQRAFEQIATRAQKTAPSQQLRDQSSKAVMNQRLRALPRNQQQQHDISAEKSKQVLLETAPPIGQHSQSQNIKQEPVRYDHHSAAKNVQGSLQVPSTMRTVDQPQAQETMEVEDGYVDEDAQIARRHLLRLRYALRWKYRTLESRQIVKDAILTKAFGPWRQLSYDLSNSAYEVSHLRERHHCSMAMDVWLRTLNQAVVSPADVRQAEQWLKLKGASKLWMASARDAKIAKIMQDEALIHWHSEETQQRRLSEIASRAEYWHRTSRPLKAWIASAREGKKFVDAAAEIFKNWYERPQEHEMLEIYAERAFKYYRVSNALSQMRVASREALAGDEEHLKWSVRADYYSSTTRAIKRWRIATFEIKKESKMKLGALRSWYTCVMGRLQQASQLKRWAERADYYNRSTKAIKAWAGAVNQVSDNDEQQRMWAERAQFYYRSKSALSSWRRAAKDKKRERVEGAYLETRRITKRTLGERVLKDWRVQALERAAMMENMEGEAGDGRSLRDMELAGSAFEQWQNVLLNMDNAAQSMENDAERATIKYWRSSIVVRENSRAAAEGRNKDGARNRVLKSWNVRTLQNTSREHALATVEDKRNRKMMRQGFETWREVSVTKIPATPARRQPLASKTPFAPPPSVYGRQSRFMTPRNRY